MNEIKKFEFEGNEITFLTGENVMINATEMAKRFNAKPESWLRTDNAQRMIDALAVAHKCETDDLVVKKQGGGEQGTWMHEDVAIVFAQWLSPEFYIWCNDRIKELFKYGVTASFEAIKNPVISLSEVTRRLKDNGECRVGRFAIYEQLRQRGILDKHNKAKQEFVDKGYFKYVPVKSNPYIKSTVGTEEGVRWLNQLLYPEQNNVREELILEGLVSIADAILIGKSGGATEEQNRMIKSHLRGFVEKVKMSQKELN